jgi:hypothetical protein
MGGSLSRHEIMFRTDYNFYKTSKVRQREPITKGGSLNEPFRFGIRTTTACHSYDPLVAPVCRQSHFNLRNHKLRASMPPCLKIGQANRSLHPH